ncbi:MAG: biotin synthase BioB [Oligoflexia bacterium]|nr:biotin synthase BioB [Oligoflexia bacterium]
MSHPEVRTNWTRAEVAEIYNLPFLDLVFRAAQVHRKFHQSDEVQVCTLLSIKTGGCTEDCKYCSQSAHYKTGLQAHKLVAKEEVVTKAREAKDNGASRFCMGAAWREIRDNKDFDRILEMVREVNGMGLEVCCTLGMLTEEQAHKLKQAGLHAYNHNLDTSESHYANVITTRTYQDRLNTIENVRKAGITVCCGGILGLGESKDDRIDLLKTLSNLSPHPESVPINALVPIEGTPLHGQSTVDNFEFVRSIATARILMPTSMVRLSAGRLEMSKETQALCFLAGANSIFGGEKLLTTPNPASDSDAELFSSLGLRPREAFKSAQSEAANG